MPDILIRGLDKHVLEMLKVRAKRNGRSLQSEAKIVLEQAANPALPEISDVLDRWKQRFAGRIFSDSADLIREDRDR